MKVLYIGYYRENSDWGRQTVNNILALEGAGVDVVCRAIDLNPFGQTPEEIKHLEKKSVEDATHCIQHVFPDHMVGSDKFFKNIGILSNNFVNLDFSSWTYKLDTMDEIWVPSHACLLETLPECLGKKSKVVPLAIDTSVFHKSYQPLNIPEVNSEFKFYTMVDSNSVTGLSWVLAAFHAEFDISDEVCMIIQIDEKGDGKQTSLMIEDLSRKIKSLLRIQSNPELYKKDIIISSKNVSYQQLFDLHSYADCYASCNTNFTFPFSEINAAGFGNTPLVSNKSSVSEYIGDEFTVDSIYQISQGPSGPWRDTNNGKDFWVRPCELDLRRKMRDCYEMYQSNPVMNKIQRKRSAIEKLDRFSFESVGKIMKEKLGV